MMIQRTAARRWALAVAACAFVMDIVDLTIVNVSLPTLRAQLGVGAAESQWLVAGYAMVFAVFLITGGRLGDIFGYRRMLLGGMAAFTAASLACGLAPDASVLVGARMAQGLAASVMLPQVGSLVQVMYPPQERVAALSLFGVMGGAAAVAGPLIGGLIIGADLIGLGWRPIFLINLPIGLFTIVAGRALLPGGGSPRAVRLDGPGVALTIATVGAVMVPLIEGRTQGWPAWSLLLLGAGLPLGAALVLYSRWRMARDGSALLVPALLRHRAFALGMGMATLFQAGLAGLLFMLTQVLQNGLGFSAEQAGLVHAPYALGSSLSIAVLARRALPRFGARVIAAGGVVMGAGLAVLAAQLSFGAPTLWTLAPTMLAMGLGMGLVVGPLGPITLSEVDPAEAGAASGLSKAMQEFGGALGVAVPGGLYLELVSGGTAARAAFAPAALLVGAALLAVAGLSWGVPKRLKVLGEGGDRPSPPAAEIEVSA
jgi:EmrB/QacA subfamily drug resistance transporter